jgi:hypothetical protein
MQIEKGRSVASLRPFGVGALRALVGLSPGRPVIAAEPAPPPNQCDDNARPPEKYSGLRVCSVPLNLSELTKNCCEIATAVNNLTRSS